MKSILITGANGQLGRELRNLLEEDSTFKVLLADKELLDVSNRSTVDTFFAGNHIDIVVNCAAYTAVDKAETDHHACYLINERGAQNLAMACERNGVFLIHISSDFVFSGETNTPLTEGNVVNPRNIYGASKLAGERMIKSYAENHIIIRTSWLYSSYGNNFVKTVLRLAEERDTVNIVFDQTGTPTYACDLAKVIVQLLHHPDLPKVRGLYHYSNEGVASWYDFAVAIADLAGIKTLVLPIETSQYKTPAQRPRFSVLNKQKIKTALGIQIPHWRASLKECVAKLKEISEK